MTYPQQPPQAFPPQTLPPQAGPQQPPPGYAPVPPLYPPRQPSPAPNGQPAAWALGLLSVLLVVLAISLEENGSNAWHSVHAWGVLAIAGAALTLAAVAGRSVGMGPQRSFQVAVAGAGGLVLYWVLFVLPAVGSNTSLLATLGVIAGVCAVWVAPGRAAATTQAW